MGKMRSFRISLIVFAALVAALFLGYCIVTWIGTSPRMTRWVGRHAWLIEDYQNETYLEYAGGHMAKAFFPAFSDVKQQKIYDFQYFEEPFNTWRPKDTYQFGHLAIRYDDSAYAEEKQALLDQADVQTEETVWDFTCYRIPSQERITQFVGFSDEIRVVQYLFLYDCPADSAAELPINGFAEGEIEWENWHYNNTEPIYQPE